MNTISDISSAANVVLFQPIIAWHFHHSQSERDLHMQCHPSIQNLLQKLSKNAFDGVYGADAIGIIFLSLFNFILA